MLGTEKVGGRRLAVVMAAILVSGLFATRPAQAAVDVYGCDYSRAEVQDLQQRVRYALDTVFTNVAVLAAQGYFPYYDVPVAAATGYSHWLNPWLFDNGIYLDPLRPQSVLVDPWGKPIGVMFIEDIAGSAQPLYVDEAGDPCMPWHEHADDFARSYFWYYRIFWQGNTEYPERTPKMMHVWYENDRGVFAHEPPSEQAAHFPPLPWKCTDVMIERGWCPSRSIPI